MPNIAAVLKEEIRRLAKKEVKAYVCGTKRAVNQYRRDIALLRRQVREQQKKLASFSARGAQTPDQPPAEDDPLSDVRFSARSVKAQRMRLGLSAEDYGRLIGVSGLTIYHWEHGKSRPRKAQLAALVAVRGIGKREALKRLETPRERGAKPRRSKGVKKG
jgi:DNA-binding transcriptional regulator YiaG